KNYRDVPIEPLAGKIVIDTNNYYPQRDGQIPELDNESTTNAELLQAHLPTSKVVKGFNHILASDLTAHATPAGTPNRRALAIANSINSATTWGPGRACSSSKTTHSVCHRWRARRASPAGSGRTSGVAQPPTRKSGGSAESTSTDSNNTGRPRWRSRRTTG